MKNNKNTPEEVQPVVDVDALLGELTKKNDEYVFKLRRILKDHQYTEVQEQHVLANLLPEMIDAQRQGKPATQIYGPVTVKADSIINAPAPKKVVPFWLSGLDLSLMFAGIFGLMYGILAYTKPKAMSAGTGIASLLIMSAMAGFLFSYYNAWTHRDKKDRGRMWLMMIVFIVIILVASFVSSSLALIDTPLTRPTTWPVYAGMAVICYGAHWTMKHYLKLPGMMG